MYEVPDFESGDVGDHVGEECVGSDIEGDSEEDVCTSLVEVAGECVVDDAELEEAVAWL